MMGFRCIALLAVLSAYTPLFAQDAATGAVRGTVRDPSGAPIANAEVTLRSADFGRLRSLQTNDSGSFAFDQLAPGQYELTASTAGFAMQSRTITVDVGSRLQLDLTLSLAVVQEKVNVEEAAQPIETSTNSSSGLIESRAIEQLPQNARRFTDLALLVPGVSQDPRGLTSSSNGDLAFGGMRGFQNNFQVDGGDNNNSFFAQARGRYRAPYQFSNEVVQEFRVSSNTYGADLGRSGGAVINVITRSGSNSTHGSLFFYLRDGRLAAIHPFVRQRYADRQDQFGGSIGGPIRRDRWFYFAGFDQHIFHVPNVVQFLDGSTRLVPSPADYEVTDQSLVFSTADQLSTLGGAFRTALIGSTGFLKLDGNLSRHHAFSARFNISRFQGDNNVFFDPASPITNFATSENGEEQVSTESLTLSLTSVVAPRITNQTRAQFSRDVQASSANSHDPLTRINNIIEGFGRSSLLPRNTNEHKWQVTDSLSLEGHRQTLKLGGDVLITGISNFFPLAFGGEYIFDDIRVNPFTFNPQTFGLTLTPLRAFAHDVPRVYVQNFGRQTTRPNTNEYSAFLQDTVRFNDHLAFYAGLRYDLQTFRSNGLVSNPAWPDSGKVPFDSNNLAPRLGLAASFGDRDRPFVMRGGFGIFYTRIPQIYNSTVELENGLNRQHISLDNANFFDRQIFPKYPAPLVACVPNADCVAPAGAAGFLTTQISAFAHDFQVPYVQQASLSVEKEVMHRTAVNVAYLFVGGRHLIRARDANLPTPQTLQYPVFNDDGTSFTGSFNAVQSFVPWVFVKTVACPFPPCIGDVQRPVAGVGTINVFESAASSTYHGFTFSAKRRMEHGLYLRLSYTWAHAIDDAPDALVAGSPSLVQDSSNTKAERASSSVDQRQRFVLAFVEDPQPFGRSHPMAKRLFNDWQLSGVFSAGSGRPITARISGDFNQDGNSSNDRLAPAARNKYIGPDYMAMDARVTRRFRVTERWRLEASLEGFNVFNRDNKRVDTTDNGFQTTAGTFVPFTVTINGMRYPGQVRQNSSFLLPTNAYAPRQLQLAFRIKF
jgi:hypothetical protein